LASAISLSVTWLFGLNTNNNAASSAIDDLISTYLDEISGLNQLGIVAGFQLHGNNSPMRLAGCVGSLSRTSLR
jgi:hypothetical protein